MGYYINPGNDNFREIRNDDYIDKSGIISVINSTIGKRERLSCVSRPRRFGKSYAANMLEAYYDCSCDSHKLFNDLEIAKDPDYEKHINKYNVLYLDITGFFADTTLEELPGYISKCICRDAQRCFTGIDESDSIKEILSSVVEVTGKQFIAIIDEWDAPVRTPRITQETQTAFLEFLRSLFKSDITKKVFAAAYMTGILPIKKDGTQSAISEFREYTMLKPGPFATYTGFLEEDVKRICQENDASFEKMKEWYDGYSLRDTSGKIISVYNPNSVIRAIEDHSFESYWGQSSAVYGALEYINMDFDGLGEAAEYLTAGLEVTYKTQAFKNDLVSFEDADDVLTILTHFGYLTYDEERKTGRIPNREIMEEFGEMIHKVKHKETMTRLMESEKFLADIIAGNTDEAASNIQNVHMKESAPLWYNDEQALRAVIKLTFFTYRDHYVKLEELPSGTGYADIAFIPKKYDPSPAIIIELKAGGTVGEAMEQIKSRNYVSSIEGLGQNIMLVAITYDKDDKTKQHYCMIEKVQVD
ncbi:MAG: AAA family ATPase [Lachnospiraceae bacterium]|nr:AAA family ATPase [Lachnospiraceae bacterium]